MSRSPPSASASASDSNSHPTSTNSSSAIYFHGDPLYPSSPTISSSPRDHADTITSLTRMESNDSTHTHIYYSDGSIHVPMNININMNMNINEKEIPNSIRESSVPEIPEFPILPHHVIQIPTPSADHDSDDTTPASAAASASASASASGDAEIPASAVIIHPAHSHSHAHPRTSKSTAATMKTPDSREKDARTIEAEQDLANLMIRGGLMRDEVDHVTEVEHTHTHTQHTQDPIASVRNEEKHHHGWRDWFRTCCWRSPKAPMPAGERYKREYAASKWKYRYYRYINPWIRMLLIIPILYAYSISSAELTYRGNVWQDQLIPFTEYLTVTKPQVEIPGRRPVILRDLMFDAIPAATGSYKDSWNIFLDFSPIFFSVLMLVAFIIRWDIVRITEYIAIQMWMFSWNGLIHVITSIPDAGNNQASCLDERYHHSGDYIFWTVTFSYCNDMMWSGHTANTLLPLIMIRRLVWDMVGWNFTWSPPRKQRSQHEEEIQQHRLTRQYSHQDAYHGNRAFIQYLEAATARRLGEPLIDETDPAHSAAGNGNGNGHESGHGTGTGTSTAPIAIVRQASTSNSRSRSASAHTRGISPSSIPPLHASQAAPGTVVHRILETMGSQVDREDNIPAIENQDIHFDIARNERNRRNTIHEANVDQDWFFHVKASPYVTSPHVARHRRLYGFFVWLMRLIFPSWFVLLCFSIIIVRYHYTMDILVAILVTLLTTSSTQLLQPMVRWLYRPYYHNYLHRSWWKPCYLRYPLNQEQINYEERVRRVGLGGYF